MCRQCAEDPSIIRTMVARCRADRKPLAAVLGQGWAALQRAIVERPRAAGFARPQPADCQAHQINSSKLTRAVELDSLGDLLVALQQRDRKCVPGNAASAGCICSRVAGQAMLH